MSVSEWFIILDQLQLYGAGHLSVSPQTAADMALQYHGTDRTGSLGHCLHWGMTRPFHLQIFIIHFVLQFQWRQFMIMMVPEFDQADDCC